MSEPRTIRLVLSPQAEKYVRRDAPVEVRRLAASGALPLGPVELATVLFALLHDPDLEVKTRARESLEKLPEAIASAVLSAADAHPALLGWLAEAWRDRADRMELLALNAMTDDRTYVLLASLPHRRVVDVVANNQTRLLRHPEIVEALGDNPLTGRATIDRILAFLGLEKPQAEVSEDGDTSPPTPATLTDEAALTALRELLGEDVSAFAPELVEELAEGETLDADKQGNLFALVQKMNVMQKIKLARMGNKEARGLLIRDRNKIVASAAIRSPKITGQEVEGFAKARNVSDEVLRIIANNRDWTRTYNVKLALATNPKCPVPTAMKFVTHLQERELRSIMKSKDVPTPISTQARRLLQKKGEDLMEERRDAAEVNARIVYWGVSGAGKRTNLRVIHAKLRPDHRGELRELPTRLDPTVSYAMLPIELGEVSGVRTRIQVLTAPSGAEQAPTRKQLLDRADGIVFVADARRARLGENLACFEELRTALAAYGRPLEQVPLVIQYNKRDLSDPYVLEELHRKLGMRGVAAFEAVARDGTAVLQTLTTISKRVIRHRREESAREALEPSAAPPAPAPPPGTTQLLVHLEEPQPAPALGPPPDLFDPGRGLDPDLLAGTPEPEALDPAGHVATTFEPSFRQAAETAGPEAAAAPAPATPQASLFAVKGLGAPALVDSHTVAVPLRLLDATGRVRQLTLRLRIEAIEDERA